MRLFNAWTLTVAVSSTIDVKALSLAKKSTSDPPLVLGEESSAIRSLRQAAFSGSHLQRALFGGGKSDEGDRGEEDQEDRSFFDFLNCFKSVEKEVVGGGAVLSKREAILAKAVQHARDHEVTHPDTERIMRTVSAWNDRPLFKKLANDDVNYNDLRARVLQEWKAFGVTTEMVKKQALHLKLPKEDVNFLGEQYTLLTFVNTEH